MKHNGHFLLEAILSFSILSIFLLLFFQNKDQSGLYAQQNTILLHDTLHLARFSAMAQDNAVRLDITEADDQSLEISGSNMIRRIRFSDEVSIRENNNRWLGFTGSGTTQRAGTISLSSQKQHRSISLAPGIGIPNFK